MPQRAPNDQVQRVTQAVVQQIRHEVFQGPLPHPDILAKYDAVVPGSAVRIITMAEEQGAHRRNLETMVVKADIAAAARGQWMGYSLGAAGLVAGFVLGVLGLPIVGSVVAGGSLVSLVSVFVIGTVRRSRERLAKYRRDVA